MGKISKKDYNKTIIQNIWFDDCEGLYYFVLTRTKESNQATMIEAGYAESREGCQEMIDERLAEWALYT